MVVKDAIDRTGTVSAPADDEARDTIITEHLGMARQLARRHYSVFEPLEDLEQVAAIGLVKAVDDYDQRRGVPFRAYAAAKIKGELWRYLRDGPGLVRIPRAIQELQGRLRRASEKLSTEGDAEPDSRTLADDVGIEEDKVIEAMCADGLRYPRSLNNARGRGAPAEETVGHDDEDIEALEVRESLRSLVNSLPPRERRVIELHVLLDLNQRQVAEIVGVSQMHVSRLCRSALHRLRQELYRWTACWA
jgi:RNA polymerase sigma-B factor